MRFLDRHEINELFTMQDCIDVMRSLFLLDPKTEIVNPLRTKVDVDQAGLIGLMGCNIIPLQISGAKVITVFHENYKQQMSSHQGVVHLFDNKNGECLISCDAEAITQIRTAAVSALATDLLAEENAKNLCLLGSGVQAKAHLESIALVRDIENVFVWSNNREMDLLFIEEQCKKYQFNIMACSSSKEAVVDADIVCTLTSSKEVIVRNEWLKSNVHVNAVGACTPHFRELDAGIIHSAFVVVDNYLSARNEAGDILLASDGKNDFDSLVAMDLNELLLSDKSLKSSKTVFESLGFAAEDIMAAFFCYQKLQEKK